MAKVKSFDGEVDRICGVFAQMREALQPVMQMLHGAAEDAVLPDDETLQREEARLEAEIVERRKAETTLARLTYEMSRQIARRKTEFEEREEPSRSDRLIGLFSRSMMQRRLEARASSPSLLLHLEELLRRGDLLAGMIREERELLVMERRRTESCLVTFIDHRPEMIQALKGETGEAMTTLEATRRVQRTLATFEGFVGEINHRIGTCDVLLHKISADMEDVLILYQVVFEASRRDGSEPLAVERFPSLQQETDRFMRGMLTIHGLNGRRERADAVFAAHFPGVVPAEPPVPTVQPAKRRWGLPRLRPARS